MPTEVLDRYGNAGSVAEMGRRDDCGLILGDMDALHRLELYTKLVMERLARKCGEVRELFGKSDGDWSQTLYAMVCRAMGGNKNKEQFLALADKVRYHMCLRERTSLMAVEAMLLGTSGLLSGEYYDDYLLKMNSEYEYLKNKYRIDAAMSPVEWDTWRVSPVNSPILRIAQLAALVANEEFRFDAVMECRSRADVQRLFVAEASEYWTTHYRLSASSTAAPKRLGEAKIDIIGINVVVPVMFAYAEYIKDEEMKSRALDLLDDIPAENNVIIRRWTGCGVPVRSAFDTQALLQLNNEFCQKNRCGECILGKKLAIGACSVLK